MYSENIHLKDLTPSLFRSCTRDFHRCELTRFHATLSWRKNETTVEYDSPSLVEQSKQVDFCLNLLDLSKIYYNYH